MPYVGGSSLSALIECRTYCVSSTNESSEHEQLFQRNEAEL